MLFLKNLLLRNFQGCCLLFNYQGSLLFLFSRSNSDILSCCFLFVKNFFVLFWKSFQNHVVLCQIMSYPAVSLTIIPLVFYSVNHFLIIFSLASEQQRLNFTLLWHLVLPKSWFSKWNSFFNPQHTSFFFCLLRLYAFSASIRHFWCQIGQVAP